MNAIDETDFSEAIRIFAGMVDETEFISCASCVDDLICRISIELSDEPLLSVNRNETPFLSYNKPRLSLSSFPMISPLYSYTLALRKNVKGLPQGIVRP
jgi:hypothetical protein